MPKDAFSYMMINVISDIFGEMISTDEDDDDEKDVNIMDSEDDISRQQSYANLDSLGMESQEGMNDTGPCKYTTPSS